MEREEFDRLECEANGMTTPVQKAELKAELMRIDYAEQIADLLKDAEPGHNYGTTFRGIRRFNILK